MVGGQGETSYATNSTIQGKAICKAKDIVQESISMIYCMLQPNRLVIADLGCSSGPNIFTAISHIIDAIDDICGRLSHQLPELMFFLNDLFGNDFNSIFKSLPSYDKKVQQEKGKHVPYYVFGAPGSFYGRLFPKESVHFMYSSYGLHWLSQVPRGLKDAFGASVNKGKIYIDNTSPTIVFESYLEQFSQDFSTFLKLRSNELVSEGRIVLTIMGRSNLQPQHGEMNHLWGSLAKALNSLVLEGILTEEKVDTFDIPFYAPNMEEVKTVVLHEGSFEIYQLQSFELNWDPFDERIDDFVRDSLTSGKNTAKSMRAVMEPMLSSHFGEAILDALFSRFATYIRQHLDKQKTKYVNLTIALKKRR